MPDKKFKIQNSKFKIFEGFTLVELLLSIALIGIVVTVALPNLRKFSGTEDASNVADKLVDVLENAQSSANNHIKCPSGNPSTNWNVVLNTSSYKVNCNNASDGAAAGNEQIINSSYLSNPNSATAYSETNNRCTNATDALTFIFSKQGLTYQCAGITQNSWPVRVSLTSGSLSEVVIIESGGVIRVE